MALPASSAVIVDSPPRFTIYFQDDEMCRRSQETVKDMILVALKDSSTETSSNSALLAKKALKYRKVFERIAGVDVNAPDFDASKLLGVDWCKIECLKEHCKRQTIGEKL